MWLTRLLLTRRSVPGRIFSGKHRVVRKITVTKRRNSVDRQKIVDNVEGLLSRPYVNHIQEHNTTAERKKLQRQAFLTAQRKSRNLGSDIHAVGSGRSSVLEHLNVSRQHHGQKYVQQ